MPEIPAEPGDWLSLYEKLLYLALDPTGETEISEDMVGGLLGPFIYWFLKAAPDKWGSVNEEMVDLIAQSNPERFELGQNAGKLIYGLVTSGHILSYVLRLARHNPALASVEKAVRILERRYTLEGASASPASIKAAWTNYKNLSPFVVGFYVTSDRAASVVSEIPTFFDTNNKPAKDIKIDPEGMKAYITELRNQNPAFRRYYEDVMPYAVAMAEQYRRAGEAHYATGQKVRNRPLLDPDATWRVPEGFDLPSVELKLERLSPEEIDAATVK